jgi:hypothetical protein
MLSFLIQMQHEQFFSDYFRSMISIMKASALYSLVYHVTFFESDFKNPRIIIV